MTSNRIGGAAGLLVVAGYVVIIGLYAGVGAPPVAGPDRLAYHAAAGGSWWGIVWGSVATDLLLVPFALALRAATVEARPSRRATADVAAAMILLFVVLDLAVTWPAYATLIQVSAGWPAADAGERVILAASAAGPTAVLSSPIQATYSVLTLALGALLAGAARLGGPGDPAPSGRRRLEAAAGIMTGIAGVGSVAQTAITGAVSPLVILATLLTMAWLAAAGVGLIGSSMVAGSAARAYRSAP